MDKKPIAYVCAEYGIENNLPIYAGGLGVLAGDLVLEAGQEGLPFYAVGLFYHEHLPTPEIANFTLLDQTFEISIETENIPVRIWKKQYGSAILFLFDAGEITKNLYGPDEITMLKQQMILGFGAVKLFKLLNIEPAVWHLNEGHTAMTLLSLALDYIEANPNTTLQEALEAAGGKVVATKHTILPGAGLHLVWDNVRPLLTPYLTKNRVIFDDLIPLASHKHSPNLFSTTELLLRFAHIQSAVSIIHADYEKAIHSGSKLIPITNGVNQKRWQTGNDKNTDRKILIDYLHDHYQTELNPQALTIIWARRFAAYKRPGLLFSDPARLEKILNRPNQPVQIIVAGKPHPADFEAQQIARGIEEQSRRPELFRKIVFIPQYDTQISKYLIAGADVWLNTPLPGQEASGTSGMKAGLNGTIQLTTNDGWIAEVDWENLGWVLTEENLAQTLYDTIENEIIPTFYENTKEWEQRMNKTKELVENHYTTQRMIKDYFTKLYLT